MLSASAVAAMAGDCVEGDDGRIIITVDREAQTLTISDNGIGMTADEVKRYINQAFLHEDFLEKYKQESDAIIGHFGLGLYSSFMVAKEVELITDPHDRMNRQWLVCDGSPAFKLESHERQEPGTDVVLHLMDEELEYLNWHGFAH